MVATDDPDVAKRVRLLRSHGMTSLTWDRHRGRAQRLRRGRAGLQLPHRRAPRRPGRRAAGAPGLRQRPARRRRRGSTAAGWAPMDGVIPAMPGGEGIQPPTTCSRWCSTRGSIGTASVKRWPRAGVQTSLHYPPIHRFSAYGETAERSCSPTPTRARRFAAAVSRDHRGAGRTGGARPHRRPLRRGRSRCHGPRRARPPGCRDPASALLPLITVGALIAWWAWKDGRLLRRRLPARRDRPARSAGRRCCSTRPGRRGCTGAARVALRRAARRWRPGRWSRRLWSPTPAVAVSDAQRVLAYAVAFGARALALPAARAAECCSALAPLAGRRRGGGGRHAGRALGRRQRRRVPRGGRRPCAIPLGYRNAEAAFFVNRRCGRCSSSPRRGSSIGGCAAPCSGPRLCAIELAVLAQSRAARCRRGGRRRRADRGPLRRGSGSSASWRWPPCPRPSRCPGCWMCTRAAAGETAASIPPLHTACAAMAVSSAGRVVGWGACRQNRPAPLTRCGEAGQRGVMGAMALVLVAAGVALGAGGGRTDRLHRRPHATSSPPAPPTSAGGSLDLRLGRGDLWTGRPRRLRRQPGGGGGRRRLPAQLPARPGPGCHRAARGPAQRRAPDGRRAGCPGAGAVRGIRGRRRDRGAAGAPPRPVGRRPGGRALSPPGPTGCCRPRSTGSGITRRSRCPSPSHWEPPRPPACCTRRTRRAEDDGSCWRPSARSRRWLCCRSSSASATSRAAWRSGRAIPLSAYSESRERRRPEPLSERPLLYEAAVAEEAGEPQRALAALTEAQKRTPTEWTLYYLEAQVLELIDPTGARRALAEAKAAEPARRQRSTRSKPASMTKPSLSLSLRAGTRQMFGRGGGKQRATVSATGDGDP